MPVIACGRNTERDFEKSQAVCSLLSTCVALSQKWGRYQEEGGRALCNKGTGLHLQRVRRLLHL